MMIAIMTQEDFYDASVYLPSQTVLGLPQIGYNGVVAVCHDFSEDDLAYLQERGATICETLPDSFFPPPALVIEGEPIW